MSAKGSGVSDGIPVNGAFDSNNSDNSSTSDCGSDSSQQHESALVYYSQSIWSEGVAAWKACMLQKQTFSCWAEKSGDDQNLIFNFNWGLQSASPKVVLASMSKDAQGFKPIWEGKTLNLGDNILPVTRNRDYPVTVSVTATPDGVGARSCIAYVPKYEAPKVSAKPDTPLTIVAQYSANPSIAMPPPYGECKCVIAKSNIEPLPSFYVGDPPPTKGFVEFTNRCGSELQLFLVVFKTGGDWSDVLINNGNKRFSYNGVKPDQTLKASLNGTGASELWVNSCPTGQFIPGLRSKR
jgi:hypothetical protein